ncbi:hypothetical protein [Celeribacter sp. SCSIO 80788]|uniref:hypothetical protein n=1 Tax=Celeribacter sp. SCSIO 80788 TaxID=3117013 RepID=UPI003DA6064D
MEKDEIIEKLKAAGIEFDARLGAEKLADLLPQEEGQEEETVEARVLRGYWPTEKQEDRVRKGQIVSVTKDALIDGMESGLLERVK